jgi:hypothetical protein
MARKKKEEPVGKPKVSQLPIPVSDSPLVVDLPDGQKLVIGRLVAGSVIEVATWRGTGRPDSRTSRLMLGMAAGAVSPVTEDGVEVPAPEVPLQGWPKIQRALLNLPKSILRALGKLGKIRFGKVKIGGLTKLISQTFKISKIAPAKEQAVVIPGAESAAVIKTDTTSLDGVSSTAEIDEWLNRIMAKSQKAAVAPKEGEESTAKAKKGSKPAAKSPKARKR